MVKDNTMITSLVTGGAGFIGSHLVEALIDQGHRVVVFDNLSTGKLDNLAAVADRIELIEGDIQSLSDIRQATKGVNLVFHLAAIAAVSQSMENPLETHATNATGTLNLLIAAHDAKVNRVVFASTCAVYGDDPKLPKRELMRPESKSPYAASKLAGEEYCHVFNELFDLETVILRFFNVFGPRQDPSSPYSGVISIFVNKMIRGEPPTIFGDGQQTRDFVYVGDVVQANLLAARAETAPGHIFNIGRGQGINLLELVQTLRKILDINLSAQHESPRLGDVVHSYSDPSLAQQKLEWQPRIDIETGLRHTILSMH